MNSKRWKPAMWFVAVAVSPVLAVAQIASDNLVSDCAKSFADQEARQFRANIECYEKLYNEMESEKDNVTNKFTSASDDSDKLLEVTRLVSSAKGRIVITAGIHGNEAVSVESGFQVFRRIVEDNLYSDYEVVVFPFLNPKGLRAGDRRDPTDNSDLNRAFVVNGDKSQSSSPWVQLISDRLDKLLRADQLSVLHLDLHGAGLSDDQDFFVIVSPESLSLASAAISRADNSFGKRAHFADSYPVMVAPKNEDSDGYPHFHKTPYVFCAPGVAISPTKGTLRDYAVSNYGIHAMVIEYPVLAKLDLVQRGQSAYVHALIDEWLLLPRKTFQPATIDVDTESTDLCAGAQDDDLQEK